jgi:hypothetical protein
MNKFLFLLIVTISPFVFGQDSEETEKDKPTYEGSGELFRIRNESVEGFYRTYDDFLNERITDTVEFYLEKNPLLGENKLFLKTAKPNGKISYELVDLNDTTYWGARVENLISAFVEGKYKDFRFYDSKALEILLVGDIWMYSTGGFHVTSAQYVEYSGPFHKSFKKNHDKMVLAKAHTPFTGRLQLAIEQAEDGHKEMAYFQKGLDGELIGFRGFSKSKILKMFEDCEEVHESLDNTKFKGQIDRVKQLYMHIDLYNHRGK